MLACNPMEGGANSSNLKSIKHPSYIVLLGVEHPILVRIQESNEVISENHRLKSRIVLSEMIEMDCFEWLKSSSIGSQPVILFAEVECYLNWCITYINVVSSL